MTPEEIQDFKDYMGEGIHAGLRKGTDAPDAHILWKAIADSESSAWSDAIDFCTWGLLDAYTITPKERA